MRLTVRAACDAGSVNAACVRRVCLTPPPRARVHDKTGMDETILPLDHNRGGGEILDDEIHAIMVRPLVRGVRLTAVSDLCLDGTLIAA